MAGVMLGEDSITNDEESDNVRLGDTDSLEKEVKVVPEAREDENKCIRE